MPVIMDCGHDELAGEAEHPVVRRLRHRRLLAFLRHQGLDATFGSMLHETDAFFSVPHLQDMVKRGQWHDAMAYLSRFLRCDGARRPLSLEALVLRRFLAAHKKLADIIGGTKDGQVLAASFSEYRQLDRNVCHGTLRLRSIMLTVVHAKQHLRVSWELVRHRAAEIAYDLVHRTPELKGMVLLAPGPIIPHNVLPIRGCTGHSYRRRKHPCPLRASALAKHYLRARGRLLSSSSSTESCKGSYAKTKTANWLADILDESLKAGKPLELHHKCPLQTSGKQDATVASSSKTTFGSLAGPAKPLGSMPVENEGAPVASVEQATTLTSHTESSGTNKHCSQEGGNAGSAHLGINPTKDPRKEPTAYDEQDHNPKRQHTSGLFGETGLMPGNEIQAGTHHELGVL